MSPFYQAALFALAILFLGFLIAMGTIMTTNLSAFVKRPMMTMLILMIICLIGLANRVDAMKGVELLSGKDLVLGRHYNIVDQPIKYPDSTFVVAIADDYGETKLYRLKELPPWPQFYCYYDNASSIAIYAEVRTVPFLPPKVSPD